MPGCPSFGMISDHVRHRTLVSEMAYVIPYLGLPMPSLGSKLPQRNLSFLAFLQTIMASPTSAAPAAAAATANPSPLVDPLVRDLDLILPLVIPDKEDEFLKYGIKNLPWCTNCLKADKIDKERAAGTRKRKRNKNARDRDCHNSLKNAAIKRCSECIKAGKSCYGTAWDIYRLTWMLARFFRGQGQPIDPSIFDLAPTQEQMQFISTRESTIEISDTDSEDALLAAIRESIAAASNA